MHNESIYDAGNTTKDVLKLFMPVTDGLRSVKDKNVKNVSCNVLMYREN